MDNSGPAFPVQLEDFRDWAAKHPAPGMSLRDWFAGMALANDAESDDTAKTAKWAYKMADAMLKHRADTGETREAARQEPEPASTPGSE